MALQFAGAVPADPTPFKYTQPDGTVIVLRNHGDEYCHWYTDQSGQKVQICSDGFVRPLPEESFVASVKAGQQAREIEDARWSSFEHPFATNFGDKKILCIIANFTDRTFTVENPHQHFYNMLNQNGYSEGGAIGSVRDYFLDNSWNGTESLYRPTFDVFGPVALPHDLAYYGEGKVNRHVEDAILDAYQLLIDNGATINVGDYDNDDDGNIDMVLFYFPGHNPAEGATDGGIWPYHGRGNYGFLGSKGFNRFFCTSEMRGASGSDLAGIGTTCHEFSHALGLPDFYDTDYATNGYNEIVLEHLDLMDSGNYNDYGRRPPYLSATERNMLGWMAFPTPISATGNYSLAGIQHNVAYSFNTGTTGEYFLLETRDGTKWDEGLPTGILVYHIDKSDRLVGGGYTAARLWEETNDINVYGGHPCYYLVPPVEATNDERTLIFPGLANTTNYVPLDWNGNTCGIMFSGISFSAGSTSFTATLSGNKIVSGFVKDAYGNPVSGARVSLIPSVYDFDSAPAMPGSIASTTTGDNGEYSLMFPTSATQYEVLSVTKEGFVSVQEKINFTYNFIEKNITLVRLEETPDLLRKYNASSDCYTYSFGDGNIAVAMGYTAEELSAKGVVGAQIMTISFKCGVNKSNIGGGVYIMVDNGESVFLKEVTSGYTADTMLSFDVSNLNIKIQDGEDLLIGYGVSGITSGGGLFYAYTPSDELSSLFSNGFNSDFTTNSIGWPTATDIDTGEYLGFVVSATIKCTKTVDFSDLGVSYIKLGEGSVPTVAVAAGKSLKSVTWTLDGVSVAEPQATTTLAAGPHTYMARLTYYDGTSERVYYDITN